MKKSRLLGALCACILAVLSNATHAAVINPILGLDIGGTLYNVTFHTGGETFNALWDADNDGVFGGGGSQFPSAPTFWGDQAGAEQARDAIIFALGSTGETVAGADGFLVPYGTTTGNITNAIDDLYAAGDVNALLTTDGQALHTWNDVDYAPAFPHASFTVVPVPAAVWLFGSGLVGLIGVARRRKAE